MKGMESVGIKMGPDKSDKNTKRSHMYQINRDMFAITMMKDEFLPNRSATTSYLLPPDLIQTET